MRKTKRKDKYKEIVKNRKIIEKLIKNGDVWDFINVLEDDMYWREIQSVFYSVCRKRKKHWHNRLIIAMLQNSFIEFNVNNNEFIFDSHIVTTVVRHKRKKKINRLDFYYNRLGAIAKIAECYADEFFGDEEYEWNVYFVYRGFREQMRIEIDNRETVFIWL